MNKEIVKVVGKIQLYLKKFRIVFIVNSLYHVLGYIAECIYFIAGKKIFTG